MTHVTCRLTAKNRDQLRDPTLGNRVWATFTFTFVALLYRLLSACLQPLAQWVWTVCPRLLPDSVATATATAYCAWVQHADHSATEPLLVGYGTPIPSVVGLFAAAVEPVGPAGWARDAGVRRAGVPGARQGPVVPQRDRDLLVARLHHLVLARHRRARHRRGVSRGRRHLPLYDHCERRAQQHQHVPTSRRSAIIIVIIITRTRSKVHSSLIFVLFLYYIS